MTARREDARRPRRRWARPEEAEKEVDPEEVDPEEAVRVPLEPAPVWNDEEMPEDMPALE